ncbi:MAG: manganese catalase family protein [Bacilli bacterium]|nr:manganese catalase family protein [Bacilli bacterium]MDD4547334.1 manganese catalase family protein [Bacilli bacterium]
MWIYEKKLEYPINIKRKDTAMARYLFAQYGGPDGELAAALRYLNQRYTMPDERGKALLTDIGTEEMAHVEMIATMIYQLSDDASIKEFEAAGLGGHYTQHDHALFPTDTNGVPFTSAYIEATGDYWADLESNMAAEQRARVMYEHLMNETDDPDVLAPLSFLRQREIVHYTRFKELRDYYISKYKRNT